MGPVTGCALATGTRLRQRTVTRSSATETLHSCKAQLGVIHVLTVIAKVCITFHCMHKSGLGEVVGQQ
jgi:hypothetical protein